MPHPSRATLTILEEELTTMLADDLLETGPEFTAESNLFDFGLDSLSTMRLIIWIEDQYGVSLPAAELDRKNLQDVHSLARLIRHHQSLLAEK